MNYVFGIKSRNSGLAVDPEDFLCVLNMLRFLCKVKIKLKF